MAGPRPLCKTHTGYLIVSCKNKASSLSPLNTPLSRSLVSVLCECVAYFLPTFRVVLYLVARLDL